ncbi:MAG: hypothetical protein M3M89_00300 [Thermoproteota archaeon]|nr:hypothetical protein [Thermoproteota archaeon]
MSDLYARSREKIRATGGMKTTPQALEETIKEDQENYQKTLDEMIAKEEEVDDHNRAVLQQRKYLLPANVVQGIDIALAKYLKEYANLTLDFTRSSLKIIPKTQKNLTSC